MNRPPKSDLPLMPWIIMVLVPLLAFNVGTSVAAFGLAVIAALARWPSGLSFFSLRRIDALIANPLTLSLILAAGIAAAIWAGRIAWRSIKERRQEDD